MSLNTRNRSEHPHLVIFSVVLGNTEAENHSKHSWEPDPMCLDDKAQINLLTAKAENQIHFKINYS